MIRDGVIAVFVERRVGQPLYRFGGGWQQCPDRRDSGQT
jgi:hypothetical protein